MTHPTLRIAACLALLVVAAPARAQRGNIDGHSALYDVALDRASARCLASIPDSALAPASYFLAASAPERTGWTNAAVPLWSTIAGDVAGLLRSSLGTAGDTLPSAEPLLDWRSAAAEVLVTAHRDGRVTWRVERGAANAADSLLVGALGALGGDGLPTWPDSLGDSSSVELGLLGVRAGEHLDAAQRTRGFMIPVFSVRQPALRRAELAHSAGDVAGASGAHANGTYVRDVPVRNDQGSVTMEFVVDTLGRVEPHSVRDLLPAGELAPMGHGAMFDNLKAHALRQRYRPASVGGCLVPITMRMNVTALGVMRERSVMGAASVRVTTDGLGRVIMPPDLPIRP